MSATNAAGRIKRSRPTKAEIEARRQALVEIVAEAAPTGVRFAFYRAESQGLVDKSDGSYEKVQRDILHLRRAGRIPWDHIVDSTRWMRKPKSWDSVEEALAQTAQLYRRNLWSTATTRVEVWCESESVAGVLYPVTSAWDVPLYPIKGQTSESFAWGAAQQYKDDPRPVRIYYVGDYDPHGLQIEINLALKLAEFSGHPDLVLHRVACTYEQVTTMRLTGGPPKSRTYFDAAAQVKRPFVGEAVQVEAIDAPILRDMVERAIAQHIDPDQLEILERVEESEKDLLRSLARGWDL